MAAGDGGGGGRRGLIFCVFRFFSVKGNRKLKFRLYAPNRELVNVGKGSEGGGGGGGKKEGKNPKIALFAMAESTARRIARIHQNLPRFVSGGGAFWGEFRCFWRLGHAGGAGRAGAPLLFQNCPPIPPPIHSDARDARRAPMVGKVVKRRDFTPNGG